MVIITTMIGASKNGLPTGGPSFEAPTGPITTFFSREILEPIILSNSFKWYRVSDPAPPLNWLDYIYSDPIKMLETILREIIISKIEFSVIIRKKYWYSWNDS